MHTDAKGNRRLQRRTRGASRGFTLVEMLGTLLIVAVLFLGLTATTRAVRGAESTVTNAGDAQANATHRRIFQVLERDMRHARTLKADSTAVQLEGYAADPTSGGHLPARITYRVNPTMARSPLVREQAALAGPVSDSRTTVIAWEVASIAVDDEHFPAAASIVIVWQDGTRSERRVLLQ